MDWTQRISLTSNSGFTPDSLCGGVFDIEVIESRPGIIVARVTGENAALTFRDEAGGHRWQRTPPTEKRGRVHTSTVTVAVLDEPTEVQFQLRQEDLQITTCRGTGAGGQNRNKTDSTVQVKHLPTGLMVRCETERSQTQNKASALALLRARLWKAERDRVVGARDSERRQQVGSGMRGDKIRTVAVQRDEVVDHRSGRRWRLKEYLRGEW